MSKRSNRHNDNSDNRHDDDDNNELKIPNINKLHEEKEKKIKSKTNIFKVILNKCIEKIIYTNRYTEKTFIIFEVPTVLIGNPGYDMNACITYMISKLSNSGYIVEFLEPFYLYIDWGSSIEKQSKSKYPSDKLKKQTRSILEKFPNASKVEFIYEDTLKRGKNKNKK